MFTVKRDKMVVCCQNLTLSALSSRSARSVLAGALFKKFGLFWNTPRIYCEILFVKYCFAGNIFRKGILK
jgi:hypothetical protein